MTKYELTLNFDNQSTTHSIQARMVDEGALLLDVGCHAGTMGAALRETKAVSVIGIDTDLEALEVAQTRLQNAFIGSIEETGWAEKIRENGYSNFDTILFGDVLEHTRNPDRILLEAASLLKHNGNIIVSIPNVAYWRVRLGLLLGKWDYQDEGILDRTHLRFFTRSTVRELIESAGYRIIDQDVAGYRLPPWLLRAFATLLGVQFVYKARKL
jgi:2-polyprenyl-3-methyl-5-hydroxy-6-metoxy-1,4-benzoquinol methylase